MDEMTVDEFLDIVMALREDIKLLKKKVYRLEREVDLDQLGMGDDVDGWDECV